jgi:CRP-like cAMP-binding protein
LFLQGDPADEIFLINGGRFKLSKILEDGTELTLDKFCQVEDQTATWEKAKVLGHEISTRLQTQMMM